MVLYVVAILSISSIPRLKAPGSWPARDKAAHLVEYGILGLLARRAVVAPGLRGWGIAAALGAAIGGLDEIYQSMVPGRYPSLVDWTADLAGAGLGAGAWPWLAGAARRASGGEARGAGSPGGRSPRNPSR